MASSSRSSLTANKEAEAQELAQRIHELADEELLQMARLLVSKPDREIFGDTEFELRDICPTCPQAAQFQAHRPKSPMSLLAQITVRRGYYYGHRCGAGLFPWDQEVGLTPKRLTPGAERAASLAGLLTDSFEEAAQKVLPELSGLRLSETTVQRIRGQNVGSCARHWVDHEYSVVAWRDYRSAARTRRSRSSIGERTQP